jgi:hypothetical protein
VLRERSDIHFFYYFNYLQLMLIFILFVIAVLVVSHFTAIWAHTRLDKDYWDVFIVAFLLFPLYTLIVAASYLANRAKASRQV